MFDHVTFHMFCLFALRHTSTRDSSQKSPHPGLFDGFTFAFRFDAFLGGVFRIRRKMDVKRGYYLSAEYLIGRHMQMLACICVTRVKLRSTRFVWPRDLSLCTWLSVVMWQHAHQVLHGFLGM